VAMLQQTCHESQGAAESGPNSLGRIIGLRNRKGPTEFGHLMGFRGLLIAAQAGICLRICSIVRWLDGQVKMGPGNCMMRYISAKSLMNVH